MSSIVIYSSFRNRKLEYVCDFIFSHYLKLDVSIERDMVAFQKHAAGIKFIYGQHEDSSIPCIPDSGALSTFSLDEDPEMDRHLAIRNNSLNFDLFAAIFFLIARVEEYRPDNRDIHDRYTLRNSLLYKKEWYKIPVVDYWIEELRVFIKELFDVSIEQKEEYRLLSTIDIDHIYAYRHKPLQIRFGSLVRDLLSGRFQRILDRFNTKDPYDTFEDIIDVHQRLYLNPVFFILCADRGPYDKTLPHTHPEYIKKVRYLNKYYNVGMHPSYASQGNRSLMEHEKMKLESLTDEEIRDSRQHFLKFKLPDTFRNLLDIGITREYSMGYYNAIGFRSGTCHVHYWYDLLADSQTELKIFPFQVMDVSLNKYMNLTVDEAFEQCKEVIDTVREVQGIFSIVWHNSSFYAEEGWQGWKELYIRILKYAKP